MINSMLDIINNTMGSNQQDPEDTVCDLRPTPQTRAMKLVSHKTGKSLEDSEKILTKNQVDRPSKEHQHKVSWFNHI